MSSDTWIHKKGEFSLLEIVKSAKSKPDFEKAGAIGLFVGVVRGENSKGERIQKLELEAYEEKANEVLARICRDLKQKANIADVQIHHLLGKFSVSEDLVYVLVAGSHRKSVFPVLEEAVERYKSEAPIFKKEYVADKKGNKKAYWTAEHGKNQ